MLDEVWDGADMGRHNGEAGGHRFNEHNAERLEIGGEAEHARVLIILVQLIRRDLSCRFAVREMKLRACANDRQPCFRALFQHELERFDQVRAAFALPVQSNK